MKEMETKEAKYRENWLVRQSHATQAEAAQISTDKLKCKWRQREGEHTGTILWLRLGETDDRTRQAGTTVALETTTPSGSRCMSVVLRLNIKEINRNSKHTHVIGAFRTIAPSETKNMRKVVSKGRNKQSKQGSKGKMVLKDTVKTQNMGRKKTVQILVFV